MAEAKLKVVLEFTVEDRSWMRVSKTAVPAFFDGHEQVPSHGDVLRLGGRQFTVAARAWEHDGAAPVLRVYLGSGHAESDTTFAAL